MLPSTGLLPRARRVDPERFAGHGVEVTGELWAMMLDAKRTFDELIERRGTVCNKWDDMGKVFGLTAPDALAMWVADMDFRAPLGVRRALEDTVAQGIYGYPGEHRPYLEAIRWWMQNRHGWTVEPEWILTAHGLVNGTALAIDAYTNPGDGVILMTPVYHAFARVVKAAGRRVTELPLAQRYFLF